MRPLFYIFLFFSLAQSQRNDIYSRPFQSDPEFDIDVQHYDIDLKILMAVFRSDFILSSSQSIKYS